MKLSAKIGAIEIANDAVRIAVVKTGSRLPKVLEMVEVTLSGLDGEALHATQVTAVREAIGKLNSPPQEYVLSIPATWSIIRLLTVPFRAKRKVMSAAPFELEPFLAIPIEDLVVDFFINRTANGQSEVLAIAVQRNALDEQLAILDEAGIAVEGAILDAISMTALWCAVRRETSGTHAIVHLLEHESILVIIEGKKLTYMRRLDSSAHALVSNPADVAREIRNVLRARAAESNDENPIQSLSLSIAALPEIECALFEDKFDIPIHFQVIASELDGVDPSMLPRQGEWRDDAGTHVNRWTAPIAAAASAAGGPFHMNFLKHQFASSKTLRRLANIGAATCLLSVVALSSFLGIVVLDHRNNLAQVEELGQAIWEEFAATYPDLAIERPRGDIGGFKSYEMMQLAADKERESTSSLSKEMFSRPTLLEILREFGRHLHKKVVNLQELKIVVTKNMTITVYGDIVDSSKFNQSLKALEKSRILTVDTGRLKRTSTGGKETFVLTASSR